MDLAIPIPTIDMAVAMRNLSVFKKERGEAAQKYTPEISKINIDREHLVDELEEALAFSFIIAYAQGLSMLAKASVDLKMEIPLSSVIQVWKAGCIIRSSLLGNFTRAYQQNPTLPSLLLDEGIAILLKERENSLRHIVSLAISSRIPVPCMSTAIAYFDSYCSERLPTNLIQAQRDFFGAHTYQRIDKEGAFHTEWHS
jgi:6-phosphogluconate dehydrogenase